MLIKMRTTLCGPYGNFSEGQTISSPEQVSEEVARMLVPQYADDITPKIEEATIAPQETAAAPAQRRRRK